MNPTVWGAAAMLSVCVVSSAFAQAETPGIDQRQGNQEKRIDQGVASGQLTQREANRLNNQQEHINKMEDQAKADGVMTKKERKKMAKSQDRASRRIARQKHDAQQQYLLIGAQAFAACTPTELDDVPPANTCRRHDLF